MDVLAFAIVWLAVGTALILLITEQSHRIAGFAQMQERQRAQVADDIREVCNDDECVEIYRSVAADMPDNLVYYALAETRQRLADGAATSAAAAFADAIRRVAGEHNCPLHLQATA